MELPAPTIQNLLDSTTLRWIFVGGKGGVGKTTCSCCIATLLAKVRERVLIISTDPAHNLSDAFNQKFSNVPTLVEGTSNLFAMEIDPSANLSSLVEDDQADLKQMLTQVLASAPGIDEYLSYIEVFRLVNNMEYSCIVFDTAPTGHTLRLLAFPDKVNEGLSKLVAMKDRFLPIANNILGMFGGGNAANGSDIGDLGEALESRLPIAKEISRQFKNAEQTTFVCVCIAEFLSMYETERLFEELQKHEINVSNIIVNQLLLPNIASIDPNGASVEIPKAKLPCKLCTARHAKQSKYLAYAFDLYEDLHIVQLPEMEDEIRTLSAFTNFAKYMLEPFKRD